MGTSEIKRVDGPLREIAAATDESERRDLARIAESLVTRGDLSGLTPEEVTRHYIRLCERLRLDPTTQPLKRLRLNGADILYPTKGATDQLASVWGIDRRMIEPPAIVDTGAGKIIRAVCEAHWRGRTDVSTGAVPVPAGGGEALCNALLKCESKSKRRATLSILGLGMLDETEVDAIPANAKQAAPQIDMGAVHHAVATMAREDGTARFVVPPVELDASGFGELPEIGPQVRHSPKAARAYELAETDGAVCRVCDGLHDLGWADDGRSVPVSLDQAAALWVDAKPGLTADTAPAVWDLLVLASNAPSTRQLKLAVARAEKQTPPDGPKGGGAPAPANDAPADASGGGAAAEAAGGAASAHVARRSPSDVRALRVADEALRQCNGPAHVAAHAAAHVGELPVAVREEYLARAAAYLAARYHRAVGSHERARDMIAAALLHRGASVAA